MHAAGEIVVMVSTISGNACGYVFDWWVSTLEQTMVCSHMFARSGQSL